MPLSSTPLPCHILAGRGLCSIVAAGIREHLGEIMTDHTRKCIRGGLAGALALAALPSAGAGYLTVTNNGTAADRLTCAGSDAAAQCQIHTMSMENGVMKMRPVEG